jgi:hypothetical protein
VFDAPDKLILARSLEARGKGPRSQGALAFQFEGMGTSSGSQNGGMTVDRGGVGDRPVMWDTILIKEPRMLALAWRRTAPA